MSALDLSGRSLLIEIALRLNVDFEDFSQNASIESASSVMKSKAVYLSQGFALSILRVELIKRLSRQFLLEVCFRSPFS